MNCLIVVCGSIAGVRAPEIIAQLQAQKINTKVLLSTGAQVLFGADYLAEHHVTLPPKATAEAYRNGAEMAHIVLRDWADCILVLGATANALSTLATGRADTLWALTVLARTCPLVVVPAMNPSMWNHPATQRNWQHVQRDGAWGVSPISGACACGDVGPGRIANTRTIVQRVAGLLQMKHQLTGQHVVVTAGAARTTIDGVRVLTNRSSGRMGTALAEVAAQLGARVTRIGPSALPMAQGGVRDVLAETNAQFAEALQHVKNPDWVLHCAALSDFAVAGNATKKMSSRTPHMLELTPQPKIIDQLCTWHPRARIVGWKAVPSENPADLVDAGQLLLRRAKLHAVVANSMNVMGGDQAACIIVDEHRHTSLPPQPKPSLAQQLWQHWLPLL